jgi:hypothetical protein
LFCFVFSLWGFKSTLLEGVSAVLYGGIAQGLNQPRSPPPSFWESSADRLERQTSAVLIHLAKPSPKPHFQTMRIAIVTSHRPVTVTYAVGDSWSFLNSVWSEKLSYLLFSP